MLVIECYVGSKLDAIMKLDCGLTELGFFLSEFANFIVKEYHRQSVPHVVRYFSYSNHRYR